MVPIFQKCENTVDQLKNDKIIKTGLKCTQIKNASPKIKLVRLHGDSLRFDLIIFQIYCVRIRLEGPF